jgi:UrcA family protein
MTSQFVRNILTAVLISGASASAAAAQDITVVGARERVVDRTYFGIDVVENSASVVVNLSDLDLGTAAGWSRMEERLTSASRLACDVVEEQNPIDIRGDRGGCARTAYRAAMTHVRQLTQTTPRVAALNIGVGVAAN